MTDTAERTPPVEDIEPDDVCGHCERSPAEGFPARWRLTGLTLGTMDMFCSITCLQHYLIDHAFELADAE